MNATDGMGITALHFAAASGAVDNVNRLRKALPEVSVTNAEGRTLLHAAIHGYTLNIVNLLLAANADATLSDKSRQTALQMAQKKG